MLDLPKNNYVNIANRVESLGKLNLMDRSGRALSDSGTVQEECCIFRVPNVTGTAQAWRAGSARR